MNAIRFSSRLALGFCLAVSSFGWSKETPASGLVEMEVRFVKSTDAIIQQAMADAGVSDRQRQTPEQVEKVFAALNKSKAETISTFRAVGMGGKQTIMKSVREVSYPTEYEFSKDKKPHPSMFESRNAGSEVWIEPTIVTNREVSLNLEARLTDLLGFVEYAPQKEPGSIDEAALRKLLQTQLKEGGIYAPVFQMARVETTSGLASGDTLMLGGLDFQAAISSPGNAVAVQRKYSVDVPSLYIFITARVLEKR